MQKRLFTLTISILIVVGLFFTNSYSRKLEIQCNTKTYGGVNGGHHPGSNVAVMFVTKADSTFIKTLWVWSFYGFDFMLKNWRTWSGLGKISMYDGETSATRQDHKEQLKAVWDCNDTTGTPVPDGDYLFWVELQEHDYFWGDHDPNEKYYGRITHGKIKIDNSGKEKDGDMSDTVFFNFKAKYDPNVGIVTPRKHSHKDISYTFDAVRQRVTFSLNKQVAQESQLHILDLKGRFVEKVALFSSSGQFVWDIQNGRTPSGVYLFELRSKATGKLLGKPQRISLLK